MHESYLKKLIEQNESWICTKLRCQRENPGVYPHYPGTPCTNQCVKSALSVVNIYKSALILLGIESILLHRVQ